MFGKKATKSDLEQLIEDQKAELRRLEKESKFAKESLAEFKHKKKMEEEDIKHMRKIEKESLEQKGLRKEIELERAKDSAIANVKDEYRDKLELRLQKEVDNIKDMYSEILQRLPNVNVRMKGDI